MGAADHLPVIDPRHPTHFVRQQRLQPPELLITQPELARQLAPVTEERESHQSRLGNPLYGSGSQSFDLRQPSQIAAIDRALLTIVRLIRCDLTAESGSQPKA